MADFVYKGVPVKDANGKVIAVFPLRSIKAFDGKHYKGVLAENSRGDRFVHRGTPNLVVPLLKVWDDLKKWTDSNKWEE